MWNQDIYQHTFTFAAIAHEGQKHKESNVPFIVHVANVCMETMTALIEDNSLDGDLTIQVALLHDIAERTTIGIDEIAEKFGQKVAEGIKAMTKDISLPKNDQLKNSVQRIKKMSPEIHIVKMADRIANLIKPPGSWDKEKIRAYWEQSNMILYELQGASEFLEQRFEKKLKEYKQNYI
jgi:guanosine-3',5'-bis(diphosphate) 3'-pyrophosphohydrolase